MTKRVALYARISRHDPSGDTLDSQIEVCRDYAAGHGYRVVAELSEDERGVSGADFDAPELGRALDLAQGGHIDALVCREMDRFARDLAKQLIVERQFQAAGVEVEYALEQFDETPEGQFRKHIRAIIAEYERLKIQERTQRGILRSVRAGNVVSGGLAPYGYRIGEVDGLRTFVPHGPEAEVVRQVFQWYARGDGQRARLSMRQIARKLSARSVPTQADKGNVPSEKNRSGRGQWAESTISVMLSNETYAGTWHYSAATGDEVTVRVEPLVDRETWDLVQRRREENRWRTGPARYDFLLRGLGVCRCGRRIYTYHKQRYFYYVCSSVPLGEPEGCPHAYAYYNAGTVDAELWRLVEQTLTGHDLLASVLDKYRQVQSRETSTADELDAITRAIDEQRQRLRRLMLSYLDGETAREFMAEMEAQIQADIDDLERERTAIQAQLDDEQTPGRRVETLQQFAAKVRDLLPVANTFERRRWAVETLSIEAEFYVDENRRKRADVSACGVPIGTIECGRLRRTDSA